MIPNYKFILQLLLLITMYYTTTLVISILQSIILLFICLCLRIFLLFKYNDAHFIINRSAGEIYLKRWFVVPRNRLFNVYLHHFYLSDLDSALHDHPWAFNISILLNGTYKEYVPVEPAKWLTSTNRDITFIRRYPFIPIIRVGPSIHRIELDTDEKGPVKIWTLFITGPTVSSWGFYCPKKKIDHNDFLVHGVENGNRISNVGKGCD